MILIINVCKERLHALEFVKPIECIIGKDFSTKYYSEVNDLDLQMADRVIICGTSLRDDFFLNDLDKFDWLRNFGKPVLGICAGYQILGLTFGCKIKKKTEIGYFDEYFDKEFFGLKSSVQVYHLHNNYLDVNSDFGIFSGGKIPQAIKHKSLPLYGVLFHPEVRNKEMILNFVNFA